jgi:hypothetical protein
MPHGLLKSLSVRLVDHYLLGLDYTNGSNQDIIQATMGGVAEMLPPA